MKWSTFLNKRLRIEKDNVEICKGTIQGLKKIIKEKNEAILFWEEKYWKITEIKRLNKKEK